MTDFSRQAALLKQERKFLEMPEAIQKWILASHNATLGFEAFFAKGGIISPQPEVEFALYSPQEPPVIAINQKDWDIQTRRGAAEYPQFKLFGTLAH